MCFPFCSLVLVEVFKGGLSQRLGSELPLCWMPAGSGGLGKAQLPWHLWFKFQFLLPNTYKYYIVLSNARSPVLVT